MPLLPNRAETADRRAGATPTLLVGGRFSPDTAARPAGTVPALLAGGLAALVSAAAIASATPLGTLFVLVSAATYALVALVVLATIGRSHAARHFGLPNMVTLARVVATALVTGYAAGVLVGALSGRAPTDELAWFFAALSTAAILADGVDGWLARHRGPATAFGARFDMEIDALLLLVLSVVAMALERAGPWVILIGAIRYLFVAAAWVWPWLSAPLPPSFRRKAVCVLQGGVLAALATPLLPPPVSLAAAAVALAALVWSFGVDTLWLARNRGRAAGGA